MVSLSTPLITTVAGISGNVADTIRAAISGLSKSDSSSAIWSGAIVALFSVGLTTI